MDQAHPYEVTYMYNNATHRANLRIEEKSENAETHYRAVIVDPPLRGTYGGFAASIELALDFLNLAMQAEGADAIEFSCHKSS